MSVSNDLFLAILAMDAYNRGYGKGLGLDQEFRGHYTYLCSRGQYVLVYSPHTSQLDKSYCPQFSR